MTTQVWIMFEGVSLEEVNNYFIGQLAGKRSQVLGWIEADLPDSACFVRSEQRTIVAANVQDCVSRLQMDQPFGFVGNIGQSLSHGLIGPGAIPVIPVQRFGWNGVFQL
jgi:hypothetical protein